MSDEAAKPVVYLDHAATSWPKPAIVCEEVVRALTHLTANAGRSGHAPAVAAARMVFETREKWAALLGAPRSEDIAFVRGCTEGLNLVLQGFLQPGGTVAVSPLEHNSVMRPLMHLAQRQGIRVETLPADPLGRIDVDASRRLARAKPLALVVVAHASNVNGVVQDLRGLSDLFRPTPILVDAAQTAGVLPIDVQRDAISFLACSSHKGLLGPTGLGVCYLAPEHEVVPLLQGGTGSRSESLEHPTFRPDRYEAGTLNLLGIAGTRGALQFLEERGLLGAEKQRLTQALVEGIRSIPGVCLQTPSDGTALCVSLTISGLRPDEIASQLEERFGVLCRPGLQCAPAAHRHLRTFPLGTVRLSPGWSNTLEEIDTAIRAVHAVATSR